MKKIKVKSSKKKADDIFSLIVRARDGKCLRCGTTKNLQCAHVINRDHLAHRWDKKSCLTLCYGCHIHWWHKEPLEAHEWLKEKYPDVFAYYWQHKQDILEKPIDYKSLIRNLREEYDNISRI